jgi:DNA-binding SARP family transcriptional activator
VRPDLYSKTRAIEFGCPTTWSRQASLGGHSKNLYCSMSWHLQVVGVVRLHDQQRHFAPERKTAAMLTYLALEGATPRFKLAGLLWPDVEERRARNNLVQALRRLKKATGVDFATGDDTLKLVDGPEVDIATLNVLAFQGKYKELLSVAGELLPYDYDDLPEFAEWLSLEREKLTHLRREALTSLIKQNEKDGEYDTALSYALDLLRLDTIAEETYRLIMRLHYLAGNRTEAMKTFERCKTVLQKELNLEPSLETHKLAADIGFGTLELTPIKPKETALPLSILRPPVFVGREKEWEQLETAWQESKVIFLSGEPGVGKTRLVQEFMEGKGPYHFLAGRPGDEAVPLASQARGLRQMLAEHPDIHLEPWIRAELSRLVPQLSEEEPKPITSEGDKLRFYEAVAETVRRIVNVTRGAIVWDDFQYFDTASFEVGQYVMSRFDSSKAMTPQRSINIFRKGELPSQTLRVIEQGVAKGHAAHIEVQPLDEKQVETLLAGLAISGLEAMSPALTRYTGGNPLFILETLKTLLESGQVEQGLPQHLPVSGKVAIIIQKRLDKLHPTSLKLARVAAVASTDFSPQLAENILNIGALELAESFAELERLHVVRGNAFAHDLIYEATLAGIPAPIKTLLHGRIAAWLEANKANPARIAQHYLDAGEEAKAAPFLFQAAKSARETFLYTDAIQLSERASSLAQRHDLKDLAFDSLLNLAEILNLTNQGKQYAQTIQALRSFAFSSRQKALAYKEYSNLLATQGKGAESELVARQGLSYAKKIADPAIQASLTNQLGFALWTQERPAEAIKAYTAVLELQKQRGNEAELAEPLINIAVALDHLERHREALEYHQQALEVARRHNQLEIVAGILDNLAVSQAELGRVRDSVETFLESQQVLERLQGDEAQRCLNLMNLGLSYNDLCDYGQALECLQKAEALAQEVEFGYNATLQSYLAAAFTTLGVFETAERCLERVLESTQLFKQHRGKALLRLSQLRHLQNLPSQDSLKQAKKCLAPSSRPQHWGYWNLQQALLLTPKKALPLVEQTLESARKYELYGLVIAAETRLAQVLLGLKQEATAQEHSLEAIRLLEPYDPVDFYRGEVLFTHYQTLKANKGKDAHRWLEQTLAWLMDVANNKVPLYRESFLSRNPVNKAILEEAERVGLDVLIP